MQAINQGVRQGCPASCVLCNIYIGQILKEWYETQPKGLKIEETQHLETILLSDDQVIVAEDEDDLQQAVINLATVVQEFNMRIKTKQKDNLIKSTWNI